MNHGAVGLAAVVGDLGLVDGLGADELGAIVLEIAALEARVAARLAALGAEARDGEHDRLLTVSEACELLRVEKSWLRRRGARLPFTVRLSDGAVRFSDQALRRW